MELTEKREQKDDKGEEKMTEQKMEFRMKIIID